MNPPSTRKAGQIPTGSYEFFIDFVAVLTESEMSPDDLTAAADDVCQRAIVVLRERAPLTRGKVWCANPLPGGSCWVVFQLFVEASGSAFEPDQLGKAGMETEGLLVESVQELFPDIMRWTTRLAYRPDVPWI